MNRQTDILTDGQIDKIQIDLQMDIWTNRQMDSEID